MPGGFLAPGCPVIIPQTIGTETHGQTAAPAGYPSGIPGGEFAPRRPVIAPQAVGAEIYSQFVAIAQQNQDHEFLRIIAFKEAIISCDSKVVCFAFFKNRYWADKLLSKI